MVYGQHGLALVTLYTRILRALEQNPALSIVALADVLQVNAKTIIRHLRELEKEGYIDTNRATKPHERIPVHSAFDCSDSISVHRLMPCSDALDWEEGKHQSQPAANIV